MKYPSINKPELWQSAIEFYQELIDEEGWNQKPMLELVRWLSASEYSGWFYPSTAHQHLCISTVGTYPERYNAPMISNDFCGLRQSSQTFRYQISKSARKAAFQNTVSIRASRNSFVCVVAPLQNGDYNLTIRVWTNSKNTLSIGAFAFKQTLLVAENRI